MRATYIMLLTCVLFTANRVMGSAHPSAQTRTDSLFDAGDFAGMLRENLTALEHAERSGHVLRRAQATLGVARSHYYLRNKVEALAWLRKSIVLANEADADTLAAKCQRSIGAIYWEQGSIDSAAHYLALAEPVLLRQDDPAELATLYGILVELHFRSYTDTVAGERYAKLGEDYARRTGDPERIAFALMKRGIVLMESGRCLESLEVFHEGERLYSEAGHLEGRTYAMSSIATAYGHCGMAEECMVMYRKHNLLRDSIFNVRMADRAAHYQAAFDTQQKEIENLALRQRNQRTLAIGAVAVLLIAFASFALNRWRAQRKQRAYDEQLRQEQLQRFRDVVAMQEAERSRIAADLHDGIGHVLGALKLNASVLHAVDANEQVILDRSRAMIDDAAKDVRQVSHRLMPRSLEDLGLMPALRELAARIGGSGSVAVSVRSTQEDIDVPEPVRIALYRIAQEVLSNMLKHAQATSINLELLHEPGCLRMVISDNGRGFQVEAMEHSEGIGWRSVRARTEMIRGRLMVQSEPGAGTRVEVELPVE